MASFAQIHAKIYNAIDDGKLKFNGKRSKVDYTDLDDLILKALCPGYVRPIGAPLAYHERLYEIKVNFDIDIDIGKIDTSWIDSPHWLSLWKALLIRKGLA